MPTLFDSAAPNPAGYRDVDVRQLAERPSTVPLRCVDVRELSEFDGVLGHIDGVQLVPLATLRSAAADWPRDADVVMVCRSGARSGKAAVLLRELGFTRVMNLRGGMLAWNAAELPVVRPTAGPPPTLAQVMDELLVGLHRAIAPETSAPIYGQGPSRESLTALLDALQAAPPARVRDTPGFERLLRECRDLLSVARPEGRG
ncbi:rhodanese-like domain-containing protein [Pyxidicoccus parkwayensis]|jgi:sulfur-carrier protein adenylyltransferase/sulfurtransferase|uniref:Rhodanese-like domain-containing protein n=1 Tax=Pyxidicoccus parkwayensis TaxID=2813578 RepID=A0ABX7NQU0_9BACT|nr:rhodanese-like domain-containing protein [Pyxidicoccus parkwaysis]QSQ21240.1 rhodanese-like domain-containing protein [Pyxidicoccus parkwaysis]